MTSKDDKDKEISRYKITLLYAATRMNNIIINLVDGDTRLARANAIRGIEEVYEVLGINQDDHHQSVEHNG
ncbi:hypothetical protein J7438_13455 [Thalassotalea sp. G20_0]|uniref:hypothetical protein n=1 Tax=Thalassotalea sp. G20_0 TaxID=2821093 RepID=UPI001ADC68B9|nr:hypothetical protein [Thalassotalea sp. G20_0]MBO9495086.1 hypothetical protein [Thalassotalea sp. G20_0]